MTDTDITNLSKNVEEVKVEDFCDDDIDEDFSKPQSEQNIDINIPLPLEQSEIDEIQNILKSKSGSELKDCLTKLMTSTMKNVDSYQNIQIGNNVQKTYGSSSKREIIGVIMSIVNQQNKNIILNKNQPIIQNTQEKELSKESREELRQKLRNKIKAGDKTNMQKMYETLQEEYEKLQQEENPTDSNETEKKKKKKKKLDPKKLQNQLINQMATYMKNTPGGFSGNPTSA